MAVIRVRDINMYYEVHGSDSGEPLVLLHGFTSTGTMFNPFLAQLGQDYQLYVLDWRGHGRTTNPKGEIKHADLADDLVAFVRQIGLRRAHFCGVSSGGVQLTFLALDFPELVQSMTYVAATYTFDERIKSLARTLAETTSEERIATLQKLHGATYGDAYAQTIMELWVAAIQRRNELPFTPASLKRIDRPALIIHGDRDSFFPIHIPVTMYQMIPKSELCILPDCGHHVSSDRPAMFVAALLQFLAKHPFASGQD